MSAFNAWESLPDRRNLEQEIFQSQTGVCILR